MKFLIKLYRLFTNRCQLCGGIRNINRKAGGWILICPKCEKQGL